MGPVNERQRTFLDGTNGDRRGSWPKFVEVQIDLEASTSRSPPGMPVVSSLSLLCSETRWRDSVAAASDSGPYITFAAAFPSDIRAAADCAGIPGLEEGREGRGRRTRYASTLEELASPPQINVVRVTVRQEPGFCL